MNVHIFFYKTVFCQIEKTQFGDGAIRRGFYTTLIIYLHIFVFISIRVIYFILFNINSFFKNINYVILKIKHYATKQNKKRLILVVQRSWLLRFSTWP